MADNYLENRMEAYRSGNLATRNRTSASMRAPRKQNQLTLTYPPMTVAIFAAGNDALVSETVAAFSAVGCKVAFKSKDAVASNRLAQRTGTRYYPHNISAEDMLQDITAHWGEPDIAIFFTFDSDTRRILPESSRRIDAELLAQRFADVAPSTLARHMVYLSHPDNAFLSG